MLKKNLKLEKGLMITKYPSQVFKKKNQSTSYLNQNKFDGLNKK